MVLDPIMGGALGAVARLAPEVLGFFDKRAERKHELARPIGYISARARTRSSATGISSHFRSAPTPF